MQGVSLANFWEEDPRMRGAEPPGAALGSSDCGRVAEQTLPPAPLPPTERQAHARPRPPARVRSPH